MHMKPLINYNVFSCFLSTNKVRDNKTGKYDSNGATHFLKIDSIFFSYSITDRNPSSFKYLITEF